MSGCWPISLKALAEMYGSDEAFGCPSFVADVHGLTAERRQAGEGARRPPPVFEVRKGRTAVAVPRIA